MKKVTRRFGLGGVTREGQDLIFENVGCVIMHSPLAVMAEAVLSPGKSLCNMVCQGKEGQRDLNL